MKQHLATLLKFLAFLILGAVLVWLAVKDLTNEDKEQIYKALSEANYTWVVLSVLAGLLAHLSRAMRWKMLLAPMGLTPKLSNTFYAVMIGYLGNLALPRLGEVLRCGILKRYENIPFTQSFGTVIAERVIDLTVMLFLFVITAWIEYKRLHAYIAEKIVAPLTHKLHSYAENKVQLFLLIILALTAILTIFLFRKKIFQNPFAQKMQVLLMNFLEGIRSVAKVKNTFLFIFHSLFIWLMYLLSVYLCVFAFKETESMTLGESLVIMCFGGLGVIATPGGIGAYQWIVLQIMLLWGYSTAIGVAFGWVAWLAQTTAILFFGLLSFGLLAVGNRKK